MQISQSCNFYSAVQVLAAGGREPARERGCVGAPGNKRPQCLPNHKHTPHNKEKALGVV